MFLSHNVPANIKGGDGMHQGYFFQIWFSHIDGDNFYKSVLKKTVEMWWLTRPGSENMATIFKILENFDRKLAIVFKK